MSVALALNSSGVSWNDDYAPVSESSRVVSEVSKKARNYLHDTAIAWEPVITASLGEISSAAATANWDGLGAKAVSTRTLSQTRRILAMLQILLPQTTPPPEILAESDGEISVDWTAGLARTISISIGDHGRINFAAQFGEEGEVHAWQSVDTTNAIRLEEDLREVARYIQKVNSPASTGRP